MVYCCFSGEGSACFHALSVQKQIIDKLPDYKIKDLLLFLQGMQFSDEIEDDLYCEKLAEDYLDNPDPDKHDAISIEDFAMREGINL